MDSITLKPIYNPYPLVDQRCIITRITHQLIFLFDYVLQMILRWCSCIYREPAASYQYCPLSEFRSLGGRVDAIRTFDLTNEQIVGDGPVEITPSTHVYPVCVAGRNRSQITKFVLEQRGVSNVEKPHGALLGMDVIDESDDHELVTYLSSMPMCSCQDDLGRYGTLARITRAGEEETRELDKFQRREWMDRHYFLRIILQRSLVITYKESFAPMITRLVEVAKKYGLGLNSVRMVPIDSVDPYYDCGVPQFVNCLDQLIQVQNSP